MKQLIFLTGLFFVMGCASDNEVVDTFEGTDPEASQLYFPPTGSAEWETVSPSELSWNPDAEQELKELLEAKSTRAFIILKDGKIAVEWYFGDHDQNTSWYWASAGKTLTAFTIGLAQEQGLLSIEDRSSDYLGEGWTGLTTEKENLITLWHQLTMTSGLDDEAFDCLTPDCLAYLADAGTRWAYHNGPYTLLQSVVANAADMAWQDYFNANLRDSIGMDGFWFSTSGTNNVYFSTARSMARFGLLNLNNGVWDGEVILRDTAYISEMKNTSQNLNKSYGYLWWLNGKDSYRMPGLQIEFDGMLVPNAPSDLYAGLGKNDQKLYIVPSQNLVVVRMAKMPGKAPLGAPILTMNSGKN